LLGSRVAPLLPGKPSLLHRGLKTGGTVDEAQGKLAGISAANASLPPRRIE